MKIIDKRFIYALVILGSICFNFFKLNAEINDLALPGNEPVVSPSSINNLDSVYFDISQAIFNGSSVDVPVYFKSDDIVNALGFAFTFDETVLEYDTIIIVANYFDSPIFSYNPLDSVVRFETFSITQPISNDTVLLKVRFNILNNQMCNTQIDSIWTSLNGDVCSYNVKGCQSVGLSEESNISTLISIYPNPVTDAVYVNAPENTLIELFDIKGSKLVEQLIQHSNVKAAIKTADFEDGIYFVKAHYNNSTLVKKIVLVK
ncbi:MAG TPA: T9SS type A sorting domain-containing protein [Bacteroidia bacterium]|nr:T9SS type A sorting domain-containing protein [Bacteroidia bacterium]